MWAFVQLRPSARSAARRRSSTPAALAEADWTVPAATHRDGRGVRRDHRRGRARPPACGRGADEHWPPATRRHRPARHGMPASAAASVRLRLAGAAVAAAPHADLDAAADRSTSSASSAGSGPPRRRPDPPGPERHASVAERGGRLDRLDLWLVVVLVVGTHAAADLPAGRAVPDALRRGLPRPDRDGVPPGLALRPRRTTSTSGPTRTWPSTRWPAGIVLWGSDEVDATSDLEVPGRRRRRRTAPDRRGRAGGRAGERLHVATGTEIRTYDLRTRELVVGRPGRRASAPWPSTTTGSQLVVGYDDGRLATLDLDLLADAGGGVGLEPIDARDGGPPGRPPARDRRRHAASWPRRPIGSRPSTSTHGRGRSARIDLPGSPTWPPAAPGQPSWPTVDDVDRSGRGRLEPRRDPARRDAADYEARLTDASPGHDGRPRRSRARARRGPQLDAAIADGTLPGIAVDDGATGRGRDRRRRRLHRPASAPAVSRRSSSTAARTAWRS